MLQRGRIAPRDGYDYGPKRNARRQVYGFFRRSLAGRIKDSRLALLPSAEGDEIALALQTGFREDHLHVIDKNPAIVASLKRRWPHIRTYGVPVHRALARMAREGVTLAAAHFDMCGNVTSPVFEQIGATLQETGVLAQGAVFVTNMLRGRERGAGFREVLHEAPIQDRDRVRVEGQQAVLRSPLPFPRYDIRPVGVARYHSTAGNQTMLSVFWQAHLAPCLCVSCWQQTLWWEVCHHDHDDFEKITASDRDALIEQWRDNNLQTTILEWARTRWGLAPDPTQRRRIAEQFERILTKGRLIVPGTLPTAYCQQVRESLKEEH